MPNFSVNDTLAHHIVTPTEAEQETLIQRRELYKEQDKMLARDWVLVAQNCKEQRERYRVAITEKKREDTPFHWPFMSFPATLDQRIQARFGPKWAQDKKIKKKIWDMFPEFRLRDKF